ncbi:MAG: AGCS family alanine or glycine:cation symporter [Rickettsiales bacterium]|jgi:AGCS family alanine or glycine:cation symporter
MKRIFFSTLAICLIALIAVSFNQIQSTFPDQSFVENIVHFLESMLRPTVSFLGFVLLGGSYEIFGEVRNINIFGLPFLVAWLIVGGIFFTFKLGFINIRLFKHAIDVARGKYAEPDAPGSITQLQALFTAVSATVGLGNIAGVAIAISIGGPGAVVWMMIAAFFAMSMKCAEVILGQKYRKFDKNGHLLAGAFYYLEDGLREKNLPKLGKILGVLAAILCIGGSIGAGLMFQSNQGVAIIADTFSLGIESKFVLVLGLTLIIGAILIGGITRIAGFAEKIVPVMAIIYITSCIIILSSNHDQILGAIQIMFSSAFMGDAIYGGVIGAIIQGIKRSAFSNEAGIGSSPIAHAAGKTREPAREGSIAILEPFIDTVMICFMTGIVIVVTGVYQGDSANGVLMTRDAFATVSSWFPYVLSAVVFLFAFSTMLTYSYYGQQAWLYLSKGKGIRICNVLFMIFIFIGGVINIGIVIDLADILFLSMAVPNLFGMYIMRNVIKNEVVSYVKRLKNGDFEALRQKNSKRKNK